MKPKPPEKEEPRIVRAKDNRLRRGRCPACERGQLDALDDGADGRPRWLCTACGFVAEYGGDPADVDSFLDESEAKRIRERASAQSEDKA